jgi:hypothetical protein
MQENATGVHSDLLFESMNNDLGTTAVDVQDDRDEAY